MNTASRLQGQASGGEILLSSRLADRLAEAPGERVKVAVKGKVQPIVAHRIAAARRAPHPVDQRGRLSR